MIPKFDFKAKIFGSIEQVKIAHVTVKLRIVMPIWLILSSRPKSSLKYTRVMHEF